MCIGDILMEASETRGLSPGFPKAIKSWLCTTYTSAGGAITAIAVGRSGFAACATHFIPRSDERDPTVEQRQCRAAIEYNRRVLIRYCSILEENPTAFDHLEGSLMIPPPVPDWVPLVKVQGGGL